MAIAYLNIGSCITRCFPYIKNNLQHEESAPPYAQDENGMNALEGILGLVQYDYYPSFPEKAAYLFCSVTIRHAFSNGNKRLAVTLLRYFLADNKVKTIDVAATQWKAVIKELFPSYIWKNPAIADPFYLLIYNLAFIASDATMRPGVSFDDCKALITALFTNIFDVPEDC